MPTSIKVQLSLDGIYVGGLLSALAEAAETFQEVRDGLVSLLETGEELFTLQSDSCAAASAGQLIVRLNPSDSLLGFMSALRARYPDFLFIKHCTPPKEFNPNIAAKGVQ